MNAPASKATHDDRRAFWRGYLMVMHWEGHVYDEETREGLDTLGQFIPFDAFLKCLHPGDVATMARDVLRLIAFIEEALTAEEWGKYAANFEHPWLRAGQHFGLTRNQAAAGFKGFLWRDAGHAGPKLHAEAATYEAQVFTADFNTAFGATGVELMED